jgi:RNA polymerase sigma-70 factor, ECF subfamily
MSKRPSPRKIQDPDEALVRAINHGQPERFAELVARYEQRLYNFGLRMCRDNRDAEDLVQETFLSVFRYLDGFRFEAKFRNWLYRIAANTCAKKRRKSSKSATEETLSLDALRPGEEERRQREIPDWASVPLNNLLNAELSQTLKAAIHSLPPKYRIVALLRDVEGFPTEEAAQILNLTPSNVKVRLHRARLFLREKLVNYFK